MTGKQMAVTVVFLAFLWLAQDALATTYQPQIAATKGTGVQTYCVRPFPWLAMAVYDTVYHRIYLNAETCRGLAKVRRGDVYDAALGVLIFGHEIQHSRGYGDEVTAECRARRRAGLLAKKLGATRARARAIVRAQREFAPLMGGC